MPLSGRRKPVVVQGSGLTLVRSRIEALEEDVAGRKVPVICRCFCVSGYRMPDMAIFDLYIAYIPAGIFCRMAGRER